MCHHLLRFVVSAASACALALVTAFSAWAAPQNLYDLVNGYVALANAKDAAARTEERAALLGKIRALLDSGVNPDQDRQFGQTALSRAASAVNPEMVKLLLEHLANPNLADERYRKTALVNLMVRIPGVGGVKREDFLAVANLLVSNGADVKAFYAQPYNQQRSHLNITAGGCYVMRQYLGAAGAKDTEPGLLEVMRFLGEHGVDFNTPDGENKTALDWAKLGGCPAIAAYLESKGAKARGGWPAKNDAPAIQAVLRRDLAALKSLPLADLEAIAGRSKWGVPSTALHLGIEQGDPTVIAALMQRKPNWNRGDQFGATPLHWAVLARNRDLVRQLMEAGADPNKEDSAGRTPFGWAIGIAPDIAAQMATTGAVPRGPNVLSDALWAGRVEWVRRLWAPGGADAMDLKQLAAMGAVEMTQFVADKIPAGPKTPQEWVADARKSQEAYAALEAKAAMPLPVTRDPAAAPGKRGNFNITLDQWAPWLSEAPAASPANATLSLHVPPSYTGNEPAAALVFVHGPRGNDAFPPKAYLPVLNKHRTIWASVSYSWEPQRSNQNAALLTIAYQLRRRFNLDPKRLYVGGFSGGIGWADNVLAAYPGVFSAGLWSGYCPGRQQSATLQARYYAQHVPMVLGAGDDDDPMLTYQSFSQCVAVGHQHAWFTQDAKFGHQLPTAESLDTFLMIAEQQR